MTERTISLRELRKRTVLSRAERDALVELVEAAQDPFLVLLESYPGAGLVANAEMARAAQRLRAALARFREEGP